MRTNITDFSVISMLCPDTEKLMLYGDRRFHNYTGITVDFEFCFETKSKEDCFSDEIVAELIDSGRLSFIF